MGCIPMKSKSLRTRSMSQTPSVIFEHVNIDQDRPRHNYHINLVLVEEPSNFSLYG